MTDDEIDAAPVGRKRKAISARTRFEIFKRDSFTCQYCGLTPPTVVLHVDHVVAVANGGSNDEINLLTACSICNGGKAAVPLERVRPDMGVQAAALKEREAQLAGYAAVLSAQRERVEGEIWRVARSLWGDDTTTISQADYASIKRFLADLVLYEVMDATDFAWAGNRNAKDRWKYFCGICWNKIKEKKS